MVFQEASKKFQECLKMVSGYLKIVSKVFQGRLRGISRDISRDISVGFKGI